MESEAGRPESDPCAICGEPWRHCICCGHPTRAEREAAGMRTTNDPQIELTALRSIVKVAADVGVPAGYTAEAHAGIARLERIVEGPPDEYAHVVPMLDAARRGEHTLGGADSDGMARVSPLVLSDALMLITRMIGFVARLGGELSKAEADGHALTQILQDRAREDAEWQTWAQSVLDQARWAGHSRQDAVRIVFDEMRSELTRLELNRAEEIRAEREECAAILDGMRTRHVENVLLLSPGTRTALRFASERIRARSTHERTSEHRRAVSGPQDEWHPDE